MDLQELYDRLLRYCYSRTQDKYLAEDIVQDTFVRFYCNRIRDGCYQEKIQQK